jgi:hypothetical protein
MHMHVTKAGKNCVSGRIENREFRGHNRGNNNVLGFGSHGTGNYLCVELSHNNLLSSDLKKCPAESGKTNMMVC